MFSDRFIFSLLVLLLTASCVFAQSKDSYTQDIKTAVLLPVGAEQNVLKLFSSKDAVIAVTPTGVFRYRMGTWTGKKNDSAWQTAALDPGGNLWLASARSIQAEAGHKSLGQPPVSEKDTILCIFWEGPEKLFVGTSMGLLVWEGSWKPSLEIKDTRVNSIVKDAQGNLYVATTNGLWRREGRKWVNLDEALMAVAFEEKYHALTTLNSGNDVVFSSAQAVSCIAGDGNHWVVTGANGLPYGPVTVLRAGKDCLWMGTAKGAIKKDERWHYFQGKR